ncbi:MAG: hypothetical protein BWX71_02447 [Deltaproteobacteria bacterium ADurb.Bin072]|nr:MAG: hypothetical protein BWX71_02447 [Deltaproteobacteria bacterium ADurb.Bin072]
MLRPAFLLRSRRLMAAKPFWLLKVRAAFRIFSRFLTATPSFLILMLSRFP